MSLISDALKRQEQLRAPGTGATQREVAAATPPEASRISAQPRRVSGATSRGIAAPPLAAPAAQPRAAEPRPPSPRQRRNFAAPAANPFAERERAAARRPNLTVLLMPILGLIMLLVLLFLRREFVPSQPLQAVTVKKVESEKWEEESSEELGIVPAATKVESPGGPGIVPADTLVDVPKEESSMAIERNRTQSIAVETNQFSTSNSLSASASSAPLREDSPLPEPSNGQTVKPSNQAVEAAPQQPAWPAFTLTGIAVGRERLAILNTGEMLLAGETSKCGVKVKTVNASNVVFAWGGETKTLRKGEHSDKPAD